MGNNISIFTDIAAIGSYVSELGDVYYEKRQDTVHACRFYNRKLICMHVVLVLLDL